MLLVERGIEFLSILLLWSERALSRILGRVDIGAASVFPHFLKLLMEFLQFSRLNWQLDFVGITFHGFSSPEIY